MPNHAAGMVDPAIFEHLQEKIDEDVTFRDALRDIVQQLEKQTRTAQAILSRAHSTPSAQTSDVVRAAEAAIRDEITTVAGLSVQASKQPYYKWNDVWTRKMQDVCQTILFCGWLNGFAQVGQDGAGKLLTIEEVGGVLNVPVNLKDSDAFHLTIEEYLLALVSLIEELARLARNSVTLGDFRRPLQISQFIKDVHAGFSILNLKNDILRKRVDGIKYRVKEVEDVVYDLSLRDLLPKDEEHT
ncbi:Translin [Tothia fuscella]|uniref:Translin n=1 Tax=Tothia fuscella TaxID=1048955 RepID=A0A9P4TXM6_9PEZI|nr:Translin [Tothia fuscella]